jgi:hypothetical protein
MPSSFYPRGQAISIRRIVVVALLLWSTATALAEIPTSSATGLLFDFSPLISDGGWQAILTALVRNDLSKLFGRPVLLLERRRLLKGTEFLEVVEVSLRGDCSLGWDAESAPAKGPLGWVYRVDGRIEPFLSVDCNRIARIVQPELRGMPISQRQRVMACAISHVILHELTHIVTQNPGHELTGPLKSPATKDDLLSAAIDVPRNLTTGASTLRGCPVGRTSSAQGHPRVETVCWEGTPCIAPPC